MEHKRWVGSHGCVSSNESVDGERSFNERCHAETQNLDDLIHWLEYANTGYPAARQAVDQEEYWAGLLRDLLCEKLIKELIVFDDNSFECRCNVCNALVRGWIHDEDTEDIKESCVNTGMFCAHLYPRSDDVCQYIFYKYKEQL